MFSSLSKVFEVVQDYIGRTLGSMIRTTESVVVYPHDGFMRPAYLSFEVFSTHRLRPIPRDSVQWWMWRYSLLCRAVPAQAKFYYAPLKTAFARSLDAHWCFPYYHALMNSMVSWRADEQLFYVRRITGHATTFLDRLIGGDNRFRMYCDIGCSVNVELLRSLLNHDGLRRISAMHLSNVFRNDNLLNIVHNLPGNYGDIERFKAYGMALCAVGFLQIANCDLTGSHMRPSFHYVQTVLEFILENPDFICGLDFSCRLIPDPYRTTYILVTTRFRKPCSPVLDNSGALVTVPDTGMLAKFQKYLDDRVRYIRDSMYPLDPCLAPKPLTYVDDLEGELRRKKKAGAARR